MGCLNVTAERIGKGISLRTERMGQGVSVTCGLVCSVNKARYLKVEPKAIFLMPGNDFRDDVLVIANVDWQVE